MDLVAVSIVTPHEFRMLQRIQKSIGAQLEAKVVPNIKSVKEKKVSSLIEKVKNQEVKENDLALVEELKEYFDISAIAYKLAAMLSDSTYIKGNNNIGKSHNDIKRLLERAASNGGGRDRNSRGNRRNHSRGGRRNSQSRNSSQRRRRG